MLRLLLVVQLLICAGVGCVVVYQVRSIATKSGRTDYALAGDSVELSCHYLMKDEFEDIKQVVWSKDGKNFLRWRKNKPGLEVLSYTYKGHIDHSSSHSRVLVHNATIDMHGKYRCSVKTDLGTQDNEHNLVVISPSQCRLNNWRVTSEQPQCRELFRLDCRHMFPRPVPSCGLWNGKLDKFIYSVALDIDEEPSGGPDGQTAAVTSPNGPAQATKTYRVKYSEQFGLTLPNGTANPQHADLLQYAGHLIFKCDILVPETSWRLSLVHRMFDFADGCNSDPLEAIERMRFEFGQQAKLRLQQHKQQQQQHQSLEQRHRERLYRPLDDVEMLTANLRYEILAPPPSSGPATGAKREPGRSLNCWQKPRIGSLARLSCVAPGSATNGTSLAPAQDLKGHLKLSGTNLLECRPSGWTLVEPGQRASLANELGAPTVPKRRPGPGRRPARQLGANKTATRVDGDRADNDHSHNAQDHHNHDHDDDNDDSSPAHNPGRTLADRENDVENDSAAYALDRDRNSAELLASQRLVRPTGLTPGELASLLPSCVLVGAGGQTSRRNGHQRHRPATLDDEGSALESRQPPERDQAQRNPKEIQGRRKTSGSRYDPDRPWYTLFVSSGAAADLRGLATGGLQLVIASTALATSMTAIQALR